MKLLLVTGAGASRELGLGQPLPLMPDWSNALCEKLDSAERNLAEAIGLRPGLSGPEFERGLGDFLRWQEFRHLEERFGGLGGPHPGSEYGEQQKAREAQTRRADAITRVLRQSLFENFSATRIDADRAGKAYGALLDHLDQPELVCATTNYDISLGTALDGLGRRPNLGLEEAAFRTPRVQPQGIVDWDGHHGGKTPLLHLHGAVGWYEDNGEVFWQGGDRAYNESLGVPVLLYPDPAKDPTRDSLVEDLWREFETALTGAEHVLVLGHSLHDPALLRALKAVSRDVSLGVTVFASHKYLQGQADEAERGAILGESARVEDLLPGAVAIPANFGAEPAFGGDEWISWLTNQDP